MAASQSPTIVRFTNVYKRYGDSSNVVEDASLDIRRGEFLTLLGPSGSGKTTLLMMLAGFEAPTGGTIEMNGRRIDKVPAHKRDIGVVFQNYALFPHLTVAQNLAFPLEVRKVPKQEIARRVQQSLDKVHLGALGGRKPTQLSGGQQQRIALARAMIFEPQLIVLDEPLGALDKNLREQMQLELKRLHRELGATMVFVTHDQSEALTLSDRVAVFDKGRIQQIDNPTTLYRHPKTPFVATFIGENNLLECEVIGHEEGSVDLRAPGGGLLRAAAGSMALSTGTRVRFTLRPEQIESESSSESSSDSSRHRLAGVVRDVIFLGDQSKLLVTFEGIGDLTVRISTRFGRNEFHPGDRHTFSYRTDHGLIYPFDTP